MPRNSSGTYSLPGGNPVVTLTTISSSWANTTMDDIADALTDSLSRSGDGGMTAVLEIVDGAVGTPALTFGTDINTGIYSNAADSLAFSAGGVFAGSFRNTGGNVQLLNADGSAAAPVFSFNSDTDVGLYRSAANTLSFATNGTLRGSVNADGQVAWGNGTVSLPSYSFSSDPDIGMFRIAADRLGFGVNGATVLDLVAGQIRSATSSGGATTPEYSWATDADTGMYLHAANHIAFSAGGRAYITALDNGLGSIGVIGLGASATAGNQINLINYVVTTTVGLAGGASALPATPVGYLVVQVNGSNMKIPYYNT